MKSLLKFVSKTFFILLQNQKKSVVQRVKIFKQSNGEFNKISNALSANFVDSYLHQIINQFLIQIKKYGLKIG
jgi:hypothetical protein